MSFTKKESPNGIPATGGSNTAHWPAPRDKLHLRGYPDREPPVGRFFWETELRLTHPQTTLPPQPTVPQSCNGYTSTWLRCRKGFSYNKTKKNFVRARLEKHEHSFTRVRVGPH